MTSVGPPDRDVPGTSTSRLPVRTCVGCRERAEKTDLVRVVVGPDGTAVPDPRGRMPGRGAWLHPDQRCLDLAERRRALARALRTKGPVDTGAVRRHVAGLDEDHVQQDGTTTT